MRETRQGTQISAEWNEAPQTANSVAVSVVMPAYNEAQNVGRQIQQIQDAMERANCPYELIVVNDGSTDETAKVVRQHHVELIDKQYNQGYGAALKSGIAAAKYDWIAIIDADGTYPAETLPKLLERIPEYDMVVAARIGQNVSIPFVRRPMKWVLGRLANYLARQPIPDLNSGMRVFRKSLAEKFEHLLPSGFSFTTTITMALLFNDYRVLYLPIDYHKRIGLSKVRALHVYDFLLVILRTVIYFNPLRFFLPFGGLFFLASFTKLIFDAIHKTLSITAATFFLAGLLLWAVGLLSDQISRIALHVRSK